MEFTRPHMHICDIVQHIGGFSHGVCTLSGSSSVLTTCQTFSRYNERSVTTGVWVLHSTQPWKHSCWQWSEMKHYSSGRVKYTGLYKILKHSSFWSKLSTIVFIYNLSHCHSIHTQGSTMSFTVNSSWGCGIHWLYIKMDNTRAPQKGSLNFAIRAIAMTLCWGAAA